MATHDTVKNALHAALPVDVFGDLNDSYTSEPRGRFIGAQAKDGVCLLTPQTTEQVAMIVRVCSDARVPIVPYAGGTGLVGGQIITPSALRGTQSVRGVVLSLARMQRIIALSLPDNVIQVEAGVTLAAVRQAATAVGRLFPLSIASEGSAQMGGILATNAGGVHVIRYGMARDLCLGVDAVLPNGDIMRGCTCLYKDNSGYDMRHLMIGSEGTLGIITAVALKVYPAPKSALNAVFAVPNLRAALALRTVIDRFAAPELTGFEAMHKTAYAFIQETGVSVRPPFPMSAVPEWSVLVDLSSAKGEQGEQTPALENALMQIFHYAADRGLVDDAVVAQNQTQYQSFWQFRDNIPEANRRIGSVSSHDISVPISRIAEFVDTVGQDIKRIADVRINCFGHLGDGNMHYNVFPARGKKRDAYEAVRTQIKTSIHDAVYKMGGSISAEHGIGRLRVDDLERYGCPVALTAMRAVKRALDPHGIMNPGVLFSD